MAAITNYHKFHAKNRIVFVGGNPKLVSLGQNQGIRRALIPFKALLCPLALPTKLTYRHLIPLYASEFTLPFLCVRILSSFVGVISPLPLSYKNTSDSI